MPELIAIHTDYKDHHDKFQILTIHDNSVKSFQELDPKLLPLKKKFWQDQDLPFPILLDTEGKTEAMLKISAHPTGLLIDPEGKLVGEAQASDLEAKLPKLPASKMWARNRDVYKNVYWDFNAKKFTFAKMATMLKNWIGVTIEVDADALKAIGLSPDSPVPGMLIGSGVTLRTIEQLLLHPHGLGFAPSADDKSLWITTVKPNRDEPASHSQKLATGELHVKLSWPAKSLDKPVPPLEVKDQTLVSILPRIVAHFDLAMALDAAAIKAGTLDPAAKVTGTLTAAELRKSLQQMLDPVGLTVEVFHDVVLIRPKTK